MRGVLRDVLLLMLAVAAGWWIRGADKPVLADRSAPVDANLSFQLSGTGSGQSLAIYNPPSHTVYIYPRIGEGNAHVNCEYSFTIERPGAPIQRQNCSVAPQY